MRMYIYFVPEFMSNKCTHVYASVRYLTISNRHFEKDTMITRI